MSQIRQQTQTRLKYRKHNIIHTNPHSNNVINALFNLHSKLLTIHSRAHKNTLKHSIIERKAIYWHFQFQKKHGKKKQKQNAPNYVCVFLCVFVCVWSMNGEKKTFGTKGELDWKKLYGASKHLKWISNYVLSLERVILNVCGDELFLWRYVHS